MVLAGEFSVIMDVILVYNGRAQSVPKFAVLVAGLFLLMLFFPGFRMERKRIAAVICTTVLVIPMLTGYLCWYSVSRSVVYRSEDQGKQTLYGDKKVNEQWIDFLLSDV